MKYSVTAMISLFGLIQSVKAWNPHSLCRSSVRQHRYASSKSDTYFAKHFLSSERKGTAAASKTRKTSRLYTASADTATSASDSSSAEQIQPVPAVPKKFVPFPFEYHQELTLRVSALTNLGIGVCRTPIEEPEEQPREDNSSSPSRRSRSKKKSNEGDTTKAELKTRKGEWVIFVPNVIPGELVRIRVFRNHKSYSDADLMEVLEPSQDRVDPVCPLATVCGGCQYQHMSIDAQRQWKTQHVQELLERIGNTEAQVSPAVGTDDVYHYRSKITPHYNAPRKIIAGKSYDLQDIGFKQKASRRLVDVPYCHIATEDINVRLDEYRSDLRRQALEGTIRRPKRGATLLLRDADEGVVVDPNQYVTTTVAGLQFRFLAGNFFQNNPHMLPLMVEYVVEGATRLNPANEKQMTHLIDCYCGSGLFCLGSASSFQTCVGIEVNDRAVEEAKANAALNNITNCDFVAASAEAIFESETPVKQQLGSNGDTSTTELFVRDFPRDTTVVVVDPPRKGCSEEFLEQLYAFSPQRVVYMSCDPATQARDAKGLIEKGGYEITSAVPFDLFPQTRHIESLVVFEKKAPQ